MTDESIEPGTDEIARSSSVLSALYFLNSGDYLFRWREESGYGSLTGRIKSKCLAAPDVTAAFSHSEVDSGWLPAGIQRHGYSPGGQWCVYAIPAQRVKITLLAMTVGPNKQAEDLVMEIPIPNLVLFGRGNRYSLFALNGPFTPERTAYHAPFPNVHGHGGICYGGNNPSEAYPGNMEAAWQLFISTPFNKDLTDGKSLHSKKDVRTSLYRFSHKWTYPVNDLISMGDSIGSVIERLIQ